MSDTVLRYVPTDPHWQPTPEAAARAVSLLETFAPRADETPAARMPGEWWGRAMDTAYAGGFKDLETVAPCCGKTVSLNELRYVWPAAFGRFALEVRNPETADMSGEQDRAVMECIGMQVRKVWAHY